MTLPPRVVLVHRTTEYDELLARHGSHGQAAFFVSTRGRDISEAQDRHALQQEALRTVVGGIPLTWRQGRVERADLSRFLFSPEDIVVVVGQDGLVANVAKYLSGQRVIGVNPDRSRNPGVLVQHDPADFASVLRSTSVDEQPFEARTMVSLQADDGQVLTALNDIYLGHQTHQTSRYSLRTPDGLVERQASSGLVVSTGTGATGWCRSIWEQRHSTLDLPAPTEPDLIWFTREAWPSPATGNSVTEGRIAGGSLTIDVEADLLVAFGDGLEEDRLTLSWGQRVRIQAATSRLNLVVSRAR